MLMLSVAPVRNQRIRYLGKLQRVASVSNARSIPSVSVDQPVRGMSRSVTLVKGKNNMIGISIGGGAPFCPVLYVVQVYTCTLYMYMYIYYTRYIYIHVPWIIEHAHEHAWHVQYRSKYLWSGSVKLHSWFSFSALKIYMYMYIIHTHACILCIYMYVYYIQWYIPYYCV